MAFWGIPITRQGHTTIMILVILICSLGIHAQLCRLEDGIQVVLDIPNPQELESVRYSMKMGLLSLQVLYGVYMFVGPWLAARYLSREVPGLFWAGGVLFRHRGAWRWRGDPDTLRVGVVHYATCVLPLTLWMATVVSSWCIPRPPSRLEAAFLFPARTVSMPVSP